MKASVIGATGYAGVELLRLLDGHPEAEIAVITSESSTGEAIASMYPHLSGRIEKNLQSMQELDAIAAASDVDFYCPASWPCYEDRQAAARQQDQDY